MAENKNLGVISYASTAEQEERSSLLSLLQECPVPQEQLLANLGLFLDSKALSRILFMDVLFRQILDVQGAVMEFGCRWGQNLALFASLRGIYDPFNRHRKLIGFDTFAGFPGVTSQDGKSDMMTKGNLAVTPHYADYLRKLLATHEKLNPLGHIPKFELRAGDATEQVHLYLKDHPETIVALAFFDFDLYKPTKEALEAIRPRLTKGSVLAFDELNDPDSPGETLALMETFGLNSIRLKRHPHTARTSYFVLE